MVYTGWFTYAGVEIVNDQRAQAYGALSGLNVQNRCAELAASLGDAPYTTPESDEAAWFDPSVPESGRFYGLVGMEIIGADSGTVQQQWSELLGNGGVPGARRRGSIELQVRASMIAADDAAMSYGKGWLESALTGSACRSNCTGDEICLYAAAPTRPSLPSIGDECTATSSIPDLSWSPVHGNAAAPGGDQLLRVAFNAAVVDGPDTTSRGRITGGLVHEVRWSMKVGIPFWHRPEVSVGRVSGDGTTVGDVVRDTIADYDPWSWQASCPQTVSCLEVDPYCTLPPLPPVAPPAPPDPCFPNNPAVNPTGYRFAATRSVFGVPRGVGTDWGEKVPVIRVFTGSLPLERLIIRWYDNPRGAPCTPADLDPCFACSELNIPWLPRNTLLTIDGRLQQALADCPGPAGSVEPRLYAADGGPIEWPVFECNSPMCCEVIAKTVSVALDSWVEINMATREAAI